MRQDCVHFYDKMAWDRTAFIFMTRPALIHFYDKMAWNRIAFIFMTSQHKTGTHPFYIGMYIHIYSHIYVHIYTSQKECLHIFGWDRTDNHQSETVKYKRKHISANWSWTKPSTFPCHFIFEKAVPSPPPAQKKVDKSSTIQQAITSHLFWIWLHDFPTLSILLPILKAVKTMLNTVKPNVLQRETMLKPC